MGFLVAVPRAFDSAGGRRFVAFSAERVVGVASVLPVPGRNGWFVEHLLFNVRAADPVVYALVAVTLGVAGGLAALVPAVRAMNVNAATALRQQ